MSKDAYYFSHDSNARNDQRLMKVRMKYGMEGYGIYFGIIEILREQAEYTLAFDDLESISFDLRVDLEKIEDIVSNYDLFVIEGMSMFYSKSLKRRLELLDKKKEARSEAGRKGGKKKALLNQKVSDAEAVKKRKVKVKESILNKVEKFRLEIFQSPITEQYDFKLLEAFFEYWSEPNKSNTKMRCEMQTTWDLSRRLSRWASNDFGNNKKNGVSGFKKDANGKFWIGYCSKCNVSDFYDDIEIKQDSRCCNSKLEPKKLKNV